MRRKIVAGNWKMNNNMRQTNSLIDSVIKKINWIDGFCRKDIGWRVINNK